MSHRQALVASLHHDIPIIVITCADPPPTESRTPANRAAERLLAEQTPLGLSD